jgi:hypothetical protein
MWMVLVILAGAVLAAYGVLVWRYEKQRRNRRATTTTRKARRAFEVAASRIVSVSDRQSVGRWRLRPVFITRVTNSLPGALPVLDQFIVVRSDNPIVPHEAREVALLFVACLLGPPRILGGFAPTVIRSSVHWPFSCERALKQVSSGK